MTTNELQPYAPTMNAQNDGCFNTLVTFKDQMDAAKMLSQAQIVPDVFRGKPADCLIALDMAIRMGLSPLQVFQHLYVVKGKPAWSGQFYIACINRCGRFTPIQYDEANESGVITKCRAFATEKASGKVLYGPWVTLEMVRSEGWGNKWKTMPEVMFRYRAAAFFVKTNCPDVTLGISMVEEVIDAESTSVDTVKTSDTKAALSNIAVEIKDDSIEEPSDVPDGDKKEALAFIDRIKAATTNEDLHKIGGEIAGSGLSANDKANVRQAYANKQAEMTAKPKKSNNNFEELKTAIQKTVDFKKLNTFINVAKTAFENKYVTGDEYNTLLSLIDKRADEIGKNDKDEVPF